MRSLMLSSLLLLYLDILHSCYVMFHLLPLVTNFVYRMLLRDIYRFDRTFIVIHVTRFTRRHLLILA